VAYSPDHATLPRPPRGRDDGDTAGAWHTSCPLGMAHVGAKAGLLTPPRCPGPFALIPRPGVGVRRLRLGY